MSMRGPRKRVVEWVSGPYPEYFSDQAVVLIRRLLAIEPHGLEAMRVLLEFSRTRGGQTEAAMRTALSAPRSKHHRLSDWDYERAIQSLVPELVEKRGLDGVRARVRPPRRCIDP